MLEALCATAEVSAQEIGSSVGESALDFDSSKPMDFSNDSESPNFSTEKNGNKESEGEIKESSISEDGKLDTSKPIDYSESSDVTSDSNFDSKNEVSEEKKGGSYNELKEDGHGWNHVPPEEVHHMPAAEAMCNTTKLEYGDCPAIAMDYADHRQTASCGSSLEAREYRAKQANLIKEGKFDEALQMDIDDIKEKFGNKYDEAIAEMKEYIKGLKENNYVEIRN